MCKLVIFFTSFLLSSDFFLSKGKLEFFLTSPLLILIVLIQTQTKLLPLLRQLSYNLSFVFNIVNLIFPSFSVEFKGQQLLEAAKLCDCTKLKKHITPEIINFQHPLTLESSLVSICGFLITSCYLWIQTVIFAV